MPGTERIIEQKYLQKSITYDAYKQLVENLLAEGKATGPQQSEAMVHYSQLNVQRMHRVEKTIEVLPEVKEQLTRRQPATNLAGPVRRMVWGCGAKSARDEGTGGPEPKYRAACSVAR